MKYLSLNKLAALSPPCASQDYNFTDRCSALAELRSENDPRDKGRKKNNESKLNWCSGCNYGINPLQG